MRVHLKNVVHSAIEKGVVVGYHRVSKLPARKRKNSDVVINTILTGIWESLDGIIDFADDDSESSEKKPRNIGFGVDAISDIPVDADENSDIDDDEDEEDVDGADAAVPLNVIHRIHNVARRRKP